MSEVLLGLDVGTTMIKTVAFTPEGKRLHRSVRENPVMNPDPRKAEQDMTTTWRTVAEVLRETTDSLSSDATVLGMGITGQGHGCWLIDEMGAPVRNAIIWSDSRAASYISDWQENGKLDELTTICGSAPYAGMSLPILCWLADEEPEVLSSAQTVFSCKDWVKYKLTGTRTTDISEAQVPYLDIETGTIHHNVFDLVDIANCSDLLPKIVTPTDVVGTVTRHVADVTGVPEGTPVVGGAIDTIVSALGSGAVRPEDTSAIIGTSAASIVICGI